MAETAHTSEDTQDLEVRVESLLSRIDETCERLGSQIDADAVASLEDEIDPNAAFGDEGVEPTMSATSTTADPGETPGDAETAATDAENALSALEQDLDDLVEALDQSSEAPVEETPAAEDEAPVPEAQAEEVLTPVDDAADEGDEAEPDDEVEPEGIVESPDDAVDDEDAVGEEVAEESDVEATESPSDEATDFEDLVAALEESSTPVPVPEDELDPELDPGPADVMEELLATGDEPESEPEADSEPEAEADSDPEAEAESEPDAEADSDPDASDAEADDAPVAFGDDSAFEEPESEPESDAPPMLADEIDAAMESALDEADATRDEAEAPSAEAPSAEDPDAESTTPPSNEIESLDAELASLTDSLLEGDFEDIDGSVTSSTQELPGVEVPRVAEAAPAASPAPTEAPVAPVSDTKAPTPRATTKAVDWRQRLRDWAKLVVPTVRRLGSFVAARGGPLLAKLVLKISAPLQSKPAMLRQSIGWVAIVTVFYAVCVWAFILFVRKPQSPVVSSPPPSLVEQE